VVAGLSIQDNDFMVDISTNRVGGFTGNDCDS
jgi:hypothetical protein